MLASKLKQLIHSSALLPYLFHLSTTMPYLSLSLIPCEWLVKHITCAFSLSQTYNMFLPLLLSLLSFHHLPCLHASSLPLSLPLIKSLCSCAMPVPHYLPACYYCYYRWRHGDGTFYHAITNPTCNILQRKEMGCVTGSVTLGKSGLGEAQEEQHGRLGRLGDRAGADSVGKRLRTFLHVANSWQQHVCLQYNNKPLSIS